MGDWADSMIESAERQAWEESGDFIEEEFDDEHPDWSGRLTTVVNGLGEECVGRVPRPKKIKPVFHIKGRRNG